MKHNGLIVRADGDRETGLGHIMRSLALAQAWRRRGGEVSFVTHCSESWVLDRLAREDFTVLSVGSQSEAWSVIEAMSLEGGSWVSLDSYRFEPADFKQGRDLGLHVLVIDDLGDQDGYAVDIVVNSGSVSPEQALKYAGARMQLLGTEFVLIRQEFLAMRSARPETRSQPEHALVSMGGTDPLNMTPRVVTALRRRTPALRISATGQYAAELSDPGVTSVAAAEMASVLASVDLAICGSGSTCWETAFMGVPTVSIVLAENQWSVAERVTRAGAAICAGWHEQINDDELADHIHSLAGDRLRRQQMSEAGRALIDGNGADRVVTACHNLA